MNLEQHYQSMWNSSLEKFRENKFQYDDMIDSTNDTRYGLTLLARPCWKIKKAISQTLEAIKTIAPKQYYYPELDLHLTVLSIISCKPGFTVDQIDQNKYRKLIQSAVQSIQPFHITFSGLTASPSSILIQGFPKNDQLNTLRNQLRDEFQHSDLQHSIDKRYRLQTAHITAVRFKEYFSNPEGFIKIISDLRNRDLGGCIIEEVELVGNDWYQRTSNTQHIHTFKLGG